MHVLMSCIYMRSFFLYIIAFCETEEGFCLSSHKVPSSEWDTAHKTVKNLRTMLPERFPRVSSAIDDVRLTLKQDKLGHYTSKPVIICSTEDRNELVTIINNQVDVDGFLSGVFGEELSGELNGIAVRVVEEDTALQLLCDISSEPSVCNVMFVCVCVCTSTCTFACVYVCVCVWFSKRLVFSCSKVP